jgi:hypothetical protein
MEPLSVLGVLQRLLTLLVRSDSRGFSSLERLALEKSLYFPVKRFLEDQAGIYGEG